MLLSVFISHLPWSNNIMRVIVWCVETATALGNVEFAFGVRRFAGPYISPSARPRYLFADRFLKNGFE